MTDPAISAARRGTGTSPAQDPKRRQALVVIPPRCGSAGYSLEQRRFRDSPA